MDLAGALDLTDRELLSFVGAGGKKTAMGRLVEQGRTRRVGYTTTTHMPPPADLELRIGGPESIKETVADEIEPGTPLALSWEWVENPSRVDEKVSGFDPETVDSLFESGHFDWLLVKADGARMREFKAPDVDEPAIPGRSTLVVPVVSAQAIGSVLTADTVHRPERVATIAPVAIGDVITPSVVGAVLASESGGLKGVPADARVVPILNKADDEAARDRAREALNDAFERTDRFDRGLITSFETGALEVVSANP